MLCQSDLGQVHELLYPARNKWYSLGLALGLMAETLNDIEDNNSDNGTRFRKMLNICLENSTSLTWSGLCGYLRRPTVGHKALAKKIEAMIRTKRRRSIHRIRSDGGSGSDIYEESGMYIAR